MLETAAANLWLFAASTLVLLIAASEIGRGLGRWVRDRRSPPEETSTAVGFVTGGLMTLFAFVLGIALSMASTRYEARRDTVLNEANAIGTVWLRAGLVGAPEGPAVRHLLRDYVSIRIAQVRDVDSDEAEARIAARTNAVQGDVWRQIESLTQRRQDPIAAALVAATNEMIDLSLTNRRNAASHVPAVIVRLMLIVSVLAVGSMGYHFGLIRSRQFVITGLLLLVWTSAIVLVTDIDNPRGGQVRVSAAPLIWTAESFGREDAPAR